MLAAPFKSCWRQRRSLFQGPTSGPDHTNLHCCRACLRTPTRTSKLIPCFSVAARTCYITAPFKSCWRLCRCFQQVLSAGPFSVQHLALLCYQNAKPVNNRYTKSLRICATADSKHVKKTHLDQSVLVSSVRTNRKIIQPLWQLEESCQDTTKRSYHKRQMLHMDAYGNSWTNTPSHRFVREEEWATETIQSNMLQTELSNFQRAAWNDSVLSRSDTSLTLGEIRHKDTCLVLVWWGAEGKLCKMLRSVSIEGFKTVVAIYAVEGPVSSVDVPELVVARGKHVRMLFRRCCESMPYGCSGLASGPDCHVTWAWDNIQKREALWLKLGSNRLVVLWNVSPDEQWLEFCESVFVSFGNASGRLFVGWNASPDWLQLVCSISARNLAFRNKRRTPDAFGAWISCTHPTP